MQPTPAPAPQGNPFVGGVMATANALQVPPEELAAIISFETGGTLDPMKAGPTTQWGQHRGFIQFGQPQASQFGVDFSTPEAAFNSQLGPDGAIVKYALAHGFIPGVHGARELYAAINAGNPNALGATDAHNGGTEGTVADKFDEQLNPHRAQVYTLFGKTYEGSSAPAGVTPGNQEPNPRITGAPSGYTDEDLARASAVGDEEGIPEDERDHRLLLLADLLKEAMAEEELIEVTPQQVTQVQMIPT